MLKIGRANEGGTHRTVGVPYSHCIPLYSETFLNLDVCDTVRLLTEWQNALIKVVAYPDMCCRFTTLFFVYHSTGKVKLQQFMSLTQLLQYHVSGKSLEGNP